MSFLSDNVIPGNHGKVFSTDSTKVSDLENIQNIILKIDGIKDVILNDSVFPMEFTVHTSKVVRVDSIQNTVKKTGFHAIPKGLFRL